MKRAATRFAFAGGVTGALLYAACRIYRQRPLERIVGFEGLDDPEVGQAFGRIAGLPQMALLRWCVARRAAALMPAGRAADLGCGPGHLAVTLAQAAPRLHVTGIDLSPELLADATDRAQAAGLAERVDFREGDAAHTPFATAALDLVVSTLSLHHWSDPAAVLNEIARVLRPGGSFLVLDLRRDLPAPAYLLLWFATHCVVPRALRRVQEPLGSRNAAYTPLEVAHLAAASRLTGWRVTSGPLWLTLEGTLHD